MELKIRVTCEEVVKPSSSVTPDHPRFYPFSFIDQFAPPYYLPFLFFYENKTNLSNTERAAHLKTSLSETLSQFYPLAGRIKKNTGVECNHEGVRFVEAKADCKMSQILENPNSYDLNKVLSFDYQEASDVPLKVQITFFDCGGLALGVATSHKLCDVLSCFMFIKNWTAFARGNTHELITPCFDLAKVFPPADMGDLDLTTGKLNQKLVTKRFVFSKSSLEFLREKFSRGGSKEFRASRVEALSGFIWSRYMASKADDKMGKMYTAVHPVDLRRLVDGIKPENMFGNIVTSTLIIPQEDEERCSLAEQMREGIKKVDKEHVKKYHRDNKELFIKNVSALNNENISISVFSSLCRVPMYELDFGWGKPLWVATGTIPYKNMVVFFETKESDGIEAWVNMEQKNMSRFEVDEELLSYVLLHTNIGKHPSLYSRL